MFHKFYSPGILAVASSLVGEDSLSHHVDSAIGRFFWVNFLTLRTPPPSVQLEKPNSASRHPFSEDLELGSEARSSWPLRPLPIKEHDPSPSPSPSIYELKEKKRLF